MKSCVYIPNKRNSNEASQLFEDLNRITKDRDVTKVLWGLAQNDEFLKELLTPILISNNIIISDDGELKIEPFGWELPDPSDLSDEEVAKALRELLGF
mgnify:CR=1 FL=1